MGLSKITKQTVSSKNIEEVIEDRSYVLTFGKYKECSIDEIIYVNPQYLRWLHDNSEWFCLGQDLLDEVDETIERWDRTNNDEQNRRTFWRRKK